MAEVVIGVLVAVNVVLYTLLLIYVLVKRNIQRQDAEQRRLRLREMVKTVRTEMGDYDTSTRRKGYFSARKTAPESSRSRRNKS